MSLEGSNARLCRRLDPFMEGQSVGKERLCSVEQKRYFVSIIKEMQPCCVIMNGYMGYYSGNDFSEKEK